MQMTAERERQQFVLPDTNITKRPASDFAGKAIIKISVAICGTRMFDSRFNE